MQLDDPRDVLWGEESNSFLEAKKGIYRLLLILYGLMCVYVCQLLEKIYLIESN
jgi:hypothetical protein